MFSKPEIKELLDQYVFVQLYTDKVPPRIKRPASSADENIQLLQERFKEAQLPLYVIMKPEGEDGVEIARYDEGKINKVDAFAEFLRKPLQASLDTRVAAKQRGPH